MKLIQVTLQGFDGSTDKTDHKIVWIVGDNLQAVRQFLDRLEVDVQAIEETDLGIESAGVDLFVTREKPPKTISDAVKSVQSDLNDFIDNLDYEMVDDIKRFNLADPELIRASELLSRKEMLEELGGIFEPNPDYEILSDNVESWM